MWQEDKEEDTTSLQLPQLWEYPNVKVSVRNTSQWIHSSQHYDDCLAAITSTRRLFIVLIFSWLLLSSSRCVQNVIILYIGVLSHPYAVFIVVNWACCCCGCCYCRPVFSHADLSSYSACFFSNVFEWQFSFISCILSEWCISSYSATTQQHNMNSSICVCFFVNVERRDSHVRY